MVIESNDQEKLKRSSIYVFMNKFNLLERKIKEDFSDNLSEFDTLELNKLYFYYGGLAGRVQIDYENDLLEYKKINFRNNEKFRNFSLKQILEISQKFGWWERYPQYIQSVTRANEQHPYAGSIYKLLSMRNRLAHELSDLKFKTRDYIEILPKSILDQKLSISFNDVVENDQIKIVLSNIVYLDIILDKLPI